VVFAAALLGTGAGATAEGGAGLYVLDAGAPALVAIDPASVERVATLPLAGNPSWLVESQDGRYLVALDYGPGESKGDRGYQARARSSATVVDAARFAVVGRVEIGWGLESVLSDPQGRLVVMTSGYVAKNPAESQPRELVILDLATARERGRLTVEPGTDLTWQSPDGTGVALLQGLPRSARYPYPLSRVTLVDPDGPKVTGVLDASGWDRAERDDQRLYLIGLGKPDKDPRKNLDGWIDVVTFAERKVERVAIGRGPTGYFLDSGRLYVASEGPPGGVGELRVLNGGKLAATLPVAARPMYVAPQGGAVWVVGPTAVTLVEPATLQVTASIPLAKDGQAVVGDGDRPFEVAVGSDRRRAFIHYPAQDKVAVLDLEHGTAVGSAKTGRGGKKFLNTMMAGLTYGMSERVYHYSPDDPPQLQVRADGRYAYALNLDTSDVTVIDGATARAVGKIGAGGTSVALLGASRLAVLGRSVHVIDTERNVRVEGASLEGLCCLVRGPSDAFRVAFGEKEIAIVDPSSGLARGRVGGFVRVHRLAFARGDPPAAAATP
jgi:DNA-binding beta-propeller fold protein YncE